jgi:hypothetical protein
MCTTDTLFAICLEAHLLQTTSHHQKTTKKKVIISNYEINITKQPDPKVSHHRPRWFKGFRLG